MHRHAWMCLLLVVAAHEWAFASEDAFRFVVAGDSRGSDFGTNTAILAEQAAAIAAEQPDLVIFTGDLVTDGTLEQLQHWVQTFMEPLLAQGIGVYPIRGNHDADIAAWRTVFSGVHALPDNGPAGEEDVTYSFVHKNALFVGLDVSATYEINQAWFDKQLAAKTVPHLFVYGHCPAFSMYHVDSLALNPAERNTFWNSIGRAGGCLYFASHDHFYNHARARDIHGLWIHQIIPGSAGAPLYSWSGTYLEAPRVQGIAYDMNYGYVVIDIEGYEVRSVFKERIETIDGVQYTEYDDVLTYTAWIPGEGLPLSTATTLIAVLAAAGLAIRRIATFP